MTSLFPAISKDALPLSLDLFTSLEELEVLLDALGSDILVRYGDGDRTTFLRAEGGTGEELTLYDVGLGDSLRVVEDAIAGGRSLRLEDGHALQAGDQVWITADTETAPESLTGGSDWSGGSITLSFLATVERVGGASVALTQRLPFDIEAGSLAVQKIESVEDIAGDGLSFQESMATAVSATGTSYIDVAAGAALEHLQHLVDTAADGTVIRLAAGTYVFDAPLEITRSNVSIEGAGRDATTIVSTSANAGNPTIQIGPSIYNAELGDGIALTRDAPAGARTMRLETGHGIEAGDRIWIERENTDAFFAEIGDTQWQKDKPLRTFLVEVVRVGGNSIELKEALPFDFAWAETTVHRIGLLDDVSVSGLSLRNTYGESDPSSFENTMEAEDRSIALSVSGTDGLALRDIEIVDPGSHGLGLAKTINAEVDDLVVHGAHTKGAGGTGYGGWLRDVYHSDFSDLVLEDTRHAVLFSSHNSATDNWIHVTSTNRDINFHGGRDQDNVVVVDSQVRDDAEQAYLGSTLFINSGESYGAPTDPEANTVTFGEVVGTVREDLIYADEDGSVIHGHLAGDTIFTAGGNDRVFAESGHDLIHASAGRDFIDGGSGEDSVVFAHGIDAYEITGTANGVTVAWWGGATEVVEVERFVFDGTSYTEAELLA